ncbi:hypothetical protein F4804DRAFT_102373 [Jackrogersella minutella]|nr:hypothetical protein F4804DRAFT_102373 [Jackrogersella minutella]
MVLMDNHSIVAVHGLDGHWKDSWTADNGIYWIRDLLADELPQSRILSYAYDSRWSADTLLTEDIFAFGKSLVSDLTELRHATNTLQRPIVFIGHSLGGIVVKTALVHSDSTRVGHLERHRNVILSTSAVLFMGTPHQGSDSTAYARILANVLSVWKNTNKAVLEHLKTHSGVLQELQSRFNALHRELETYYFYELRPMPGPAGIGGILVVPKFSAVVPGTPDAEEIRMDADHCTIVKYSSSDDQNFHRVASRLRRLSTSSPAKVQKRWAEWLGLKPTSPDSFNVPIETLSDPREFQLGSMVNRLRNEKFVGRFELIDTIRNRLGDRAGDNERKLLVLYGPGGVGKTQIALEYTYRWSNDYTTIIWLDATSESSLIGSVGKTLNNIKYHYEYIGIPKNNYFYKAIAASVENGTAPIETLHRWLSDKRNRNWLIIIDNLDDLESFDFKKFLPPASWGTIIITSRRADLQIRFDAVQVEPMLQGEALKLLREKSKLEIKESSPEFDDAQMLLADLGHFPLAVAHAGSFIALESMTDLNPIKRYREILADVRHGGPGALFNSPSTPITDYDKGALFTTWEISFNSVKQQNPDAAYIILRIGFLDRDKITENFFTCGSDFSMSGEQFRIAMRLLISYSLVDSSEYNYRRNVYRCFTVHPLVQSWVIGQIRSEEQLQVLREVAIMAYRLKLSESKYPQICDRPRGILSLHLDAIFANCERYSEGNPLVPPSPDKYSPKHPLNIAYGWYLWLRATGEDAAVFTYRWLTDTQVIALETWEIMHALRRERYKTPSRFLSWVVSQAMSVYPRKHPRVLSIVGDYAHELYSEHQYSEAEMWYLWLFDSRRSVLGYNHPATMGALMGLGKISLYYHENCDDALSLLMTAVETRERLLGPYDFLTSNAKDALRKGIDECLIDDDEKTWVQTIQRATRYNASQYLPAYMCLQVAEADLQSSDIPDALTWWKNLILGLGYDRDFCSKAQGLKLLWDYDLLVWPEHLQLTLWQTLDAARKREKKAREFIKDLEGHPFDILHADAYFYAVTMSLALVGISLGKYDATVDLLEENIIPLEHDRYLREDGTNYYLTDLQDYGFIPMMIPEYAHFLIERPEDWWVVKHLGRLSADTQERESEHSAISLRAAESQASDHDYAMHVKSRFCEAVLPPNGNPYLRRTMVPNFWTQSYQCPVALADNIRSDLVTSGWIKRGWDENAWIIGDSIPIACLPRVKSLMESLEELERGVGTHCDRDFGDLEMAYKGGMEHMGTCKKEEAEEDE